ncbi:meckelin [Orussus abietinus]|uniref:meckelin n=1 Tax=Orussus abietinus TaxID=222816 RepID=UPI000C715DA7|nr:meckelin [Orussus abietinus]
MNYLSSSAAFLFYFIYFSSSNEAFKIENEIFDYADPSKCKANEYFDAATLSCAECDFTRNLVPSDDRRKCVCNKDSKETGWENGLPICVPCGHDEVVTTSGTDCIPCKKENNRTSCTCLPNEIKVERNISGELLDFVQCLPCSENFYPASDATKCLPCQGVKGHVNCACPLVSHVRIQNYCLHKSGLGEWPDTRSTYLVKFKSQTVDSYYLRTELRLTMYLCKNGDTIACERLSNMCALTLFSEGVACKLFTDKSLKDSPVWLFYREGDAFAVLNRKKISQSYSLGRNDENSKLNLTVARFSLEGEIKSVDVPELFCHWLRDIRFGVNVNRRCKLSAKALLNSPTEFFSPYLAYNEKGKLLLYTLPVLIKNLNFMRNENDFTQWQLVRRFFLVDSVTGFKALPNSIGDSYKRESEISVLRYLKSLSVLIKVQDREERGKIFPPQLVLEYSELTRQEILDNVEVILDYKVTYDLTDSDMDSAVEVTIGILSGFAVAFSAIKAWGYCRRNYNGVPNALVFLWFLIYCLGTVGNVLILVSLSASIYTFVFYKGQTVLHILLPNDSTETNIRVCTIIGFCFKTVEVAALIFRLRSVSIFFIDWEQPRTIQVQSQYDSPHTSLRKLYTNRFTPDTMHRPLKKSSEILAAKRSKTPSKSSRENSPRRSAILLTRAKHEEDLLTNSSATNSSVGTPDDHDQSQNVPVSIWRTYFVAKAWLEIQTKRRVNMYVQGILTLILLEVVGLKFWALAVPELITENEGDYFETKQNFTLRHAIGGSTYISIYITQWLIIVVFYERFIKNRISDFIDICSVANISVFILALDYYGFYIHGRSVHGFADTDLATLINNLKKEEQNLCAHRGLIPGTTEQTFIMSVSRTFREFYNKILNMQATNNEKMFRRHFSDTINSDRSVQGHNKMRRFLTNFLDHCFKDLDYVTKERQFLEKLCGIEFTDTSDKSVFYIDNNHSFDHVIFYGNEWTLASFELTIFLFIELLWGNYILAVIITVILSQVLIMCTKFHDRQNVAKKTLIDERLLM